MHVSGSENLSVVHIGSIRDEKLTQERLRNYDFITCFTCLLLRCTNTDGRNISAIDIYLCYASPK